MMNGGGAKEAGAGGGRWCGSMPNYHLCARATFAALNKRAGDEGGGVGSNFIQSFRSWRRQGLARLINFAARFLTMATFELCAISLAKHWGRVGAGVGAGAGAGWLEPNCTFRRILRFSVLTISSSIL